jgi:hypothetical protein
MVNLSLTEQELRTVLMLILYRQNDCRKVHPDSPVKSKFISVDAGLEVLKNKLVTQGNL